MNVTDEALSPFQFLLFVVSPRFFGWWIIFGACLAGIGLNSVWPIGNNNFGDRLQK